MPGLPGLLFCLSAASLALCRLPDHKCCRRRNCLSGTFNTKLQNRTDPRLVRPGGDDARHDARDAWLRPCGRLRRRWSRRRSQGPGNLTQPLARRGSRVSRSLDPVHSTDPIKGQDTSPTGPRSSPTTSLLPPTTSILPPLSRLAPNNSSEIQKLPADSHRRTPSPAASRAGRWACCSLAARQEEEAGRGIYTREADRIILNKHKLFLRSLPHR